MSNRRNRSGRVRRSGYGEGALGPWRWKRPLGTFLLAFAIFLGSHAWYFDGAIGIKGLIFSLVLALVSTVVEEFGNARHQRNVR